MENIEKEGKVVYLPWYMAMFLKQERIERGTIVDVDLSALSSLPSLNL